MYSKEAHLNHGLNEAIKKKIRSHMTENSPQTVKNVYYENLAQFRQFFDDFSADAVGSFLDCCVEIVVQIPLNTPPWKIT